MMQKYSDAIAEIDRIFVPYSKSSNRVEYTAYITVESHYTTYHTIVHHKNHHGLMQQEHYFIENVLSKEWRDYDRWDFDRDDVMQPEIVDLKIIEIDKKGNQREV